MKTMQIDGGVAHKMPADLRKALSATAKTVALWQDITPLARNEFICWVENAKQIETRKRRVRRTCEELQEGKRRPCCWMGCPHRMDKPAPPSVRWLLGKQAKKST